MIQLRKIDGDNIEEVISLEVEENQKEFLETTNLRSFADAHAMNSDGTPANPLAIYVDDVLIGFVMYVYDTLDNETFENMYFYEKKSYFISHFMIGKNFQGKGYGKESFAETLRNIETMPYGEAEYIVLFYNVNNIKAKTLYSSFSFTETGVIMDNSMLAIKNLDLKI
jgi:diamine N-acetyltransferase